MSGDAAAPARRELDRYFALCVATLVGATTLLWLGKIPPAEWGSVVVYALGIYILGDRGADAAGRIWGPK